MIPCRRCGKPVPEVLGAELQVCPHCGQALRTPGARLDAARLFGRGLARLVARPAAWWGVWIVPALVVDAATYATVVAVPETASLVAGCGGGAGRPGVAAIVAYLALVAVTLFAYFAGWAATAAEHAGVRRDGAWWRRVAAGSALLAALFTAGLLLVVPAILFFGWFLLAPVALGRGARPLAALEEGRALGRTRPSGFAPLCGVVVLVVELLLLLAGCAPGLLPSLAAQGLVWWLLAPLVPVATSVAWDHLAPAKPT